MYADVTDARASINFNDTCCFNYLKIDSEIFCIRSKPEILIQIEIVHPLS